MQPDSTHFLPYLFTEPIYVLKKDLDVVEKKNGSLQDSVTSDSEPGKDQVQKQGPILNEPVQKLATNTVVVEPAPILKYFGKNLKKVLIIYENKSEEKLPSAQEIFLGKIINAVGLNFDDIALVNAAHLDDAMMEQVNDFDALVQLSFGVKSQLLYFKPETAPYLIFNQAGKTLLLADGLDAIEKEKDKKILLWNNLKSLFSK